MSSTLNECGCKVFCKSNGDYIIEYCNKDRAAPAMYEALKKMLSVWCCKDLHRTQYEQVIKALAKAEGKQ